MRRVGDRPDSGGSARSRRSIWAGYAACGWALSFAALSFYWAVGGTAAAQTIGPAITELAADRDPTFVAVLWLAAVLKVMAGLLALALVLPRNGLLPRPLLLAAARVAAGLLTLYGAANLVQHALMVAGAIATPVGLGEKAARWHLLLWDPWWLLGGILFGLAAWQYSRA